MSLPPTLIISSTSTFNRIWRDRGSGAKSDVTFWRPDSNFFICGDYAQPDHHDAVGKVITLQVQNDDPTQPLLAPPQTYTQIWTERGSPALHEVSVWYAVAPEGYVSIGYVANQGHGMPSPNNMRCVRSDLVVRAAFGDRIWSDRGSGAKVDVEIYAVLPPPSIQSPFGLFYAQPNYHPPLGDVFAVSTTPNNLTAPSSDGQAPRGPVQIVVQP